MKNCLETDFKESNTIIGHLDKMFPLLTATFVYREIQALQAKGINIQTFSIWKPKLCDLSNEAKIFLDNTFYIFPINWAFLESAEFIFISSLGI